MLEELDALIRISEIDAKAFRADTELKEIPERMGELQGDVSKLGELLESERQELAEADRLLTAQEEEINRQSQALAKSKAKGARASNIREADAVERELEAIRRSMRDREAERETLKAAIEKRRKSFEKHEKEFGELKAFATKEQEKADSRLAELEAERSTALAGREEFAAKISGAVARRYDLIRTRRGGSAVSEIKGGCCSGCNMAIAPQQGIRVQRAETLEQCPNCQRWLYSRQALADEASEASPDH